MQKYACSESCVWWGGWLCLCVCVYVCVHAHACVYVRVCVCVCCVQVVKGVWTVGERWGGGGGVVEQVWTVCAFVCGRVQCGLCVYAGCKGCGLCV